jgi:hypothetical protein
MELPFAKHILGHGTPHEGDSKRRRTTRSSDPADGGSSAPQPTGAPIGGGDPPLPLRDREEPSWLKKRPAARARPAATPKAAPKAVAKRPAAAAASAIKKKPAAAAAEEEAQEEAEEDPVEEDLEGEEEDEADEENEEDAAEEADGDEDGEEEEPEIDEPVPALEEPIQTTGETMQIHDEMSHEVRVARRHSEGYSIIQVRVPGSSSRVWRQIMQFSDKQFESSTSHGRTSRQQCDHATKAIPHLLSLRDSCLMFLQCVS